jgi:hypothetical protein
MLKRETCSECGSKISTVDIKDGIARKVEGKFYCRTCLLDLGLLTRRKGDTEAFITGIKDVLGKVEMTHQETLLVERKTRVQVNNFLETILSTIEAHPSWTRGDITEYIKKLLP